MILRIFRAKVNPGQVAAFEAMTRAYSLPAIPAHPGLVAFYPGRPIDASTREFVMVTVWESLAAVEAFTGPDWRRTVMISTEEQPLLESCTIEHYEFYSFPAPEVQAPAAPRPVTLQ
jgi:heme-degrading monooxygenase HmoA